MQDWHAFHSAFILITSPAKNQQQRGNLNVKRLHILFTWDIFCGILDHCQRKYVPN